MVFVAGQVLTAAQLNALPKIVRRARRVTNSTGTTTEIGVERLDDIPILAGRCYEISTTTLIIDGTSDGGQIAAHIRYTTDGSTPTTASPIIPGGNTQFRQAANAVTESAAPICTTYTPVADETLSLLLTVRNFAGGGTVAMAADSINIIEMRVKDLGPDPGDTGVDI